MNQLPLNIIDQLPYRRSNLVLHSGIAEIYQLCLQAASSEKFQILFIEGESRSGKTHLSVALSEDLLSKGNLPRLISGQELNSRLKMDEFSHDWQAGDVLIVDDADRCFKEIEPGSSGRFVDLVETMRTAGSTLMLLSTMPRPELPCDEHVLSRLNQGAGFIIGSPEPEELSHVIDAMARQRGMNLSIAKRQYLARRVSRKISKIEERLENVSYLSRLLGEKVKFPLLAKSI